MAIDEATGLPRLPEGEIWDIGEHRILIKSAPIEQPWGIKDAWLIGVYESYPGFEVKCEKKFYTETETKWFRKVPVEKTREVWYVRPVAERKVLWEEKYGKRVTYFYIDDLVTEADPVTPENVIERCEAILAARAAKAKRESLYGEYPPKKFTTGENNG